MDAGLSLADKTGSGDEEGKMTGDLVMLTDSPDEVGVAVCVGMVVGGMSVSTGV